MVFNQGCLSFLVLPQIHKKTITYISIPITTSKRDSYLRTLRICNSQYLDEEFEYTEHSIKNLKCRKVFILNARKKLFRYTHQINLGKTTPLLLSPTDLSLYPLTHIKSILRQTNQIRNTSYTNHITDH